MHNVSDVRQIGVHMDEPLVPGPSCLEVEIAIAIAGSDQILAELLQAKGVKHYCLLVIKLTVIFIMGYQCYQLKKNVIECPLKVKSIHR
jgi:hypothetical protein